MREIAIEYRNLWKVFAHPVLAGIDLEIFRGETLSVIGPSGTGKSVLLKTTVGLLLPDRGEVRVGGRSVSHGSEDDRIAVRSEVGYVFQGAALFDSLSVYENVLLGIPEEQQRSLGQYERVERVAHALEQSELEPARVLGKMPSELSGGMRKRVGLARALIGRPRILLYDEPVTGLDPVTSRAVHDLIARIGQDVTNVVVTHDIAGALAISDRVALLEQGRIRFAGTPDDFRTSMDPLVVSFRKGSVPSNRTSTHD